MLSEGIDLTYINEMCVRENEAFQTCLKLGERNYQKMREKTLRGSRDVTAIRGFPTHHYPYECDVLAENEKNCLNFWTRISQNFNQKGLFPERHGTPDSSASKIIADELKGNSKLPYVRK